MTSTLIKEKLSDSDQLMSHPGAVVTDSFVNKIKYTFDTNVMESRVNILLDLAKDEYHQNNITKLAIQSIAKDHKIHYFLTHDKELTMKKVMKKFSTDC